MNTPRFALKLLFIGSTKHQVLHELKVISNQLNGVCYNSWVTCKKSKYTLLRGPFVHKKSLEQLEYIRYSVKATIHWNSPKNIKFFLNSPGFKHFNFKYLKSQQLQSYNTYF
jgi:hypothetical protein